MALKKVELLAPAKNLACGIAAINHGADAVYIGAMQFGARQSAGNSVEDIAALVDYAHLYNVKVYVTLNTIIDDEDIQAVEKLIEQLYRIGVDALIVQDLGILKMNIPPIQLHASTQTDNRDAEKVNFLAKSGLSRVVLARELSLEEIADIHNKVPETELEVFVHGALCVSYSGQCYASQHCFGRSANKGACAQFCRLSFDLIDAEGKVLCKDKHLLSLKDMNRSEYIEQMLDAGVTSFKIEGRLKDELYVKNVTAYYRAKIDDVLKRRKEYVRTSYGKIIPSFTPVLEKSFNRGFTDYFLKNKNGNIASIDTPKSVGEYMGRVDGVSRNFFTLNGKHFNNGDGACFVGKDGKLHGFRINKIEKRKIFPYTMPPLFQGVDLYRNYDLEFERLVTHSDNQRTLSLHLEFSDTEDGFVLKGRDESGVDVKISGATKKDIARTSQRENIVKQLKKWGNTHFSVSCVDIQFSKEWFVPSSLLSDMRRRLCESLVEQHRARYVQEKRKLTFLNASHNYMVEKLDYRGNVSNSLAIAFYKEHGVKKVEPAFEIKPIVEPIMFCKYCIKRHFGWCRKEGNGSAIKEPLYLKLGDGQHFRLAFDCAECIMKVIPVENRSITN